MAKFSIYGTLSNIQILVHTALRGALVGCDASGNKYYRGKARRPVDAERRWVIYPSKADASLVPPEWHGWLHHQTDVVPEQGNQYRQAWQKPHLANMTGTPDAYSPLGETQQRAKATGDYTAWQPPQN